MAKVLGIAGSPRKGGNSDLLLDSFLEGARSSGHEVEKIYICNLNISPCDEGNSCHKTGECRIKDDMQGLYKKLLAAETLAISSPTFFMGPPAQLKAMIDRCQALWAKRFILKKPLREDDKKRSAFLLVVSAFDKDEAYIATKTIVRAFFYVLGLKYKGELLIGGVDKKGAIKDRKDALEKARKMGENL